MKAYKVFGIVLAPIAVVLFLGLTCGIFGSALIFMYASKNYRRKSVSVALLWDKLQGVGRFWTQTMWRCVLFPCMWIRRQVVGTLPPLPRGAHRIITGNHPSYIASLGSAYLMTVINELQPMIIGKEQNLKHPVNGFILRTAQLLGWTILINQKKAAEARQRITHAVRTVQKAVCYLVYLDTHRFTKKYQHEDFVNYGSRIRKIRDFNQTLVPRTGGVWRNICALREAGVPIQVIDSTVFFDCVDLGLSSLFRIFGSTLYIEIADISVDIEKITTEEELRDYLNELYRAKNRQIRILRGICHPE